MTHDFIFGRILSTNIAHWWPETQGFFDHTICVLQLRQIVWFYLDSWAKYIVQFFPQSFILVLIISIKIK